MLLSDITQLVTNLLSSSVFATNSDELIYNGIVAGHYAILPYVPNIKETTISGSNMRVFTLPNDVYSIEVVYQPTKNTVLQRASLTPGALWGTSTQTAEWLPAPTGHVSLTRVIDVTELGIIYNACWELPESIGDIDFELTVPSYAVFGIALYATSYVLGILSTDTSQLGQYKTRIDSGTPTDNPIENSSKFFFDRFLKEMSRMPTIQRLME